MRSTLWSRAARPKLNGSPVSTSTSSACRPSISRNTTSGPVRRQITVNDVFTLLLTPILATALLADTSWKDKRRKDWTHKIAELEAETEQIQSRATRSWQVLQTRSLQLGAAQQRRQYSAVALRLEPEDDGSLPHGQPELAYQHLPIEEWEGEPTWFEATPKTAHDSANDQNKVPKQDLISFSSQAVERSERLRRLLAVKLALNLTMYLNTGVSPSKVRREIRIPDLTLDLNFNPQGLHYGIPKLLRVMRHICSSIEKLQKELPNGASPVKNESLSVDSEKLQNDITLLSERYQTNSIEMPEFIDSYTVAVLQSPVPPTSKAYLALFRGFARGSSGARTCHDLAMQTLFAWEQSKLPIDDHDLFVILSELARRKHVQKFDGLMRDLTMSPSPINATSEWTWEQANDMQVPVPKSRHPALLTTLIHCALRFDQPQKAEAWCEILRRTWIDVNDARQKTPVQQVFTNWMRYYEVQGNWRRGVAWLDAAQKWAITVASFDMYSLQRLAVGMLGLCFACGKSQEYEEILNAAIQSGMPSVNPEHFLESSPRRAICREWEHLHREAYRCKIDSRTDGEKVQAFQRKVKSLAQRLLPKRDEADLEWRYEQEFKPNPLMADPVSVPSDQTSSQAVALWQQIYAKNQEALNGARTAAKNLQMQCSIQEQRMRSMSAALEYQKQLVQELTGIRQTTPPLEKTESIPKQAKKASETDTTRLPARAQAEVGFQTSEVAQESILSGSRPGEPRFVRPGIISRFSTTSSLPQPSIQRGSQRKTEPSIPDDLEARRNGRSRTGQSGMPEGDLPHTDLLLSHLVKDSRSASAQG